MILKPHSNNGIAFGPDGRLYFGVGSTTNAEFETNNLAASISWGSFLFEARSQVLIYHFMFGPSYAAAAR